MDITVELHAVEDATRAIFAKLLDAGHSVEHAAETAAGHASGIVADVRHQLITDARAEIAAEAPVVEHAAEQAAVAVAEDAVHVAETSD